MNYRDLNQTEIFTLEKNGCLAESWDNVLVTDKFDASRIKDVWFSGNVKIGERVQISGVRNLSNYEIEDDAVLDNVAELSVTGETAFGNGVQIDVLNEGGGRELTIFDTLSAQMAYMMVVYRHDTAFVRQLEKMIQVHVEKATSDKGRIGKGATVKNCGTIRNVNIGEWAKIDGAIRLEEGTIKSCKEDPAHIGAGVIVDHFIVLSGSTVDSGTLLSKCFVGQGVCLGKEFSAENSAFFANCEGFHSEACSVFAGPYTVTHHRSTLLIAGLFSFYNAGSGTNQSNHMYKLGPLHQGILDRGAKTGSFSYLLWPSRVGAFTAVVGKHYSNFDASNFPFSYITEEDGKTVLTPAMNLFTVGTRRDSEKWPTRDRRKDLTKLDQIHFDLFNPYVMEKVWNGMAILQSLYDNASRDKEFVNYEGLQIRRLMLKTSRKYYDLAVNIFTGEQTLKRLDMMDESAGLEAIQTHLSQTKDVDFHWVDLAGMLAPKSDVDGMMVSVKNDEIQDVIGLGQALKNLSDKYDEAAWAWCVQLLQKKSDIKMSEIKKEELVQIIEKWKTSSLKLNNMILKDAEKEFDEKSKIGFGLDGSPADKDRDFAGVRGIYEDNRFVKEIRIQSKEIEAQAEMWISRLNG